MALIQTLIVHSSESIRNLVKQFLHSEFSEIDIHETASGEKALDLMLGQTFDVILSQRKLPDMSCLGFNDHKQRIDINANTPIIVLTAPNVEGDVSELIDGGMEDYLVFPFTPVKMKDKILAVANPRTKRQHDRFHIPGAKAIFHLEGSQIEGTLLNISKGGILIEIVYNRQPIDLLKTNRLTLQFPAPDSFFEIKQIECKISGMKVIDRHPDHCAKTIRISYSYLNLSVESEYLVEQVLELAKEDKLYDSSSNVIEEE